MYRKAWLGLVAGAALMSSFACSEQLDAGNACLSDPTVCPQGDIALRDTILEAVTADTTVVGLPPIGVEDYMLLANHGDSLDTRVIVRYDTLMQKFSTKSGDSTIARVDSAYVKLLILVPDSAHKRTGPFTINVYDVDTSAALDTVSSAISSLFRPDRFLGSAEFTFQSLTDTLRVPVSDSAVLDKVKNGKPLRLGFQMVGTTGDLLITSTNKWAGTTLTYRASPDTTVSRVTATPLSHTPTDQSFLAGALADYVIVARTASPPVTSSLLSVGGEPSRRVYMRFDLPSSIVDSSTIVRATILLTQAPNQYGAARLDTMSVVPGAVLVSPQVKDVFTALQFMSSAGSFGLSVLRTVPADSGVKEIDIVQLVRTWRGQTTTANPRVVALRSATESQSGAEVDFYSTKAAAAVRPRLRVTYVPRTSFGVP